MATVGAVSNPDHMNTNWARPAVSAGWASARSVRGVVMNPVDHPHGGGEGRTSGGRHPVTPWGKPTKGKRTRSNKRPTSSSSARATAQEVKGKLPMSRSVWKGPFVDGYLLKKAEKARERPQRGHQDLVAPLDDPAAVRRSDLRRLQRPEAHSGARCLKT
jgi:hypothetical protein